MSHGPKIQNANLNIRIEQSIIDNLRKTSGRQGRTVSDIARSALSAATSSRTPAELVEHARLCGFDARQALVHACTVSDNMTLRAAAAMLLAYGETEVEVGPAAEAGSVTAAYLAELGLHSEHGPLVFHDRDAYAPGTEWMTFFLD